MTRFALCLLLAVVPLAACDATDPGGDVQDPVEVDPGTDPGTDTPALPELVTEYGVADTEFHTFVWERDPDEVAMVQAWCCSDEEGSQCRPAVDLVSVRTQADAGYQIDCNGRGDFVEIRWYPTS